MTWYVANFEASVHQKKKNKKKKEKKFSFNAQNKDVLHTTLKLKEGKEEENSVVIFSS